MQKQNLPNSNVNSSNLSANSFNLNTNSAPKFALNSSTNSLNSAKNSVQNLTKNAWHKFTQNPQIIASKAFITKEFLHIFRDIRTLMILVLMPLIQILLFGFALSSEVKNVKFALLDLAKNSESSELVWRLSQNPYFQLYENLGEQPKTSSEFLRVFNGSRVDFILIIPSEFKANSGVGLNSASANSSSIPQAILNANSQIQLILDASDANRASTINIYVSNIITQAFASQNSPINTSTTMLFNPQGKSAPNFVPGLLGLILMLICAMMTSVSIVREKEQGSMEVLLISPLRPVLVIISKLVPYFLLSFGILVLTLIVCVFVLDLAVAGSLFALVFLNLLYIVLALSIGLMVSNLAKTQIVAMLVCAMLFMMPVMMFSGMLFPVESMPRILQGVSHLIPTKWFIIALKKIMIEGLSVAFVFKEILILSISLALVLLVSLKTYKIRL